jgi:hypothetical protein
MSKPSPGTAMSTNCLIDSPPMTKPTMVVEKADLYVRAVEDRLKDAFSDDEFQQLRLLLERAESVFTAKRDGLK